MSSAPAPFVPFAVETNYPAGAHAWNGQPLKVQAAQDYFSPNVPLPAENVNFELNRLGVGIAAAIAYVLGITFQAGASILPLATIEAVAWDPVTLKWLAAGIDTTPDVLVASGRGDPFAWQSLAPADTTVGLKAVSVCRGVESAVANKYVYVASLKLGSPALTVPTVNRLDTLAGTWSGAGVDTGASDATSMQLLSVPGVVVCAVGATSAGHTNVFYSTDHGVTWTAQPFTLTLGSNFLMAQKAPGVAPILAFPQILALGAFLSSVDGTTWTLQSGITLGANEAPIGLCWGADSLGGGCWILTTYDAVALVTRTYRSYNGTTFASFTNTLPGSLPIGNLQALGPLVVGTTQESSPFRVFYSVDGGANWQVSNAGISTSSGAGGLAGGPNQFLGWSDLFAYPTNTYGSPGGLGAR